MSVGDELGQVDAVQYCQRCAKGMANYRDIVVSTCCDRLLDGSGNVRGRSMKPSETV